MKKNNENAEYYDLLPQRISGLALIFNDIEYQHFDMLFEVRLDAFNTHMKELKEKHFPKPKKSIFNLFRKSDQSNRTNYEGYKSFIYQLEDLGFYKNKELVPQILNEAVSREIFSKCEDTYSLNTKIRSFFYIKRNLGYHMFYLGQSEMLSQFPNVLDVMKMKYMPKDAKKYVEEINSMDPIELVT
ncbi:hypothetical protein ACFL1H_04865 [Nanoarchaeota archaeon]